MATSASGQTPAHIEAAFGFWPPLDIEDRCFNNHMGNVVLSSGTRDELVLRRRAYWLNPKGHAAATNQGFITVHIPSQNLFKVENL